DWTGRIARVKGNELMKLKDERLSELEKIISINGFDLDYSSESLQMLNDFVCSELEEYAPKLNKSMPAFNEYAVLPYFRSLAIDCTLYLGDILIKNDPDNLKWDVYKSSQKRLLHKFYPTVTKGETKSIFASSIHLYFVQYLGGFNNNKKRFIDIYTRSCHELNIDIERTNDE
ncbi:hypothetical protein LR004_01265, partial [Candidatus Gracilibacteria bacterium]|nr:hypothetical protein [Candidatus Gracilibacteria bacterium]